MFTIYTNSGFLPSVVYLQGLVTAPFREYWTSPYSSHYRAQKPNGWVMFNGDIFHDPWLITLVHPQSHGIALFLEVTMGIVVKASERWQAAQAPIFGFWICLPSGNGWHSYRKWPIYSWFTYKKWWFSIAMFVYQRVRENWKRKPSTFHGEIHGVLFRFSLKPIDDPSLVFFWAETTDKWSIVQNRQLKMLSQSEIVITCICSHFYLSGVTMQYYTYTPVNFQSLILWPQGERSLG